LGRGGEKKKRGWTLVFGLVQKKNVAGGQEGRGRLVLGSKLKKTKV